MSLTIETVYTTESPTIPTLLTRESLINKIKSENDPTKLIYVPGLCCFCSKQNDVTHCVVCERDYCEDCCTSVHRIMNHPVSAKRISSICKEHHERPCNFVYEKDGVLKPCCEDCDVGDAKVMNIFDQNNKLYKDKIRETVIEGTKQFDLECAQLVKVVNYLDTNISANTADQIKCITVFFECYIQALMEIQKQTIYGVNKQANERRNQLVVQKQLLDAHVNKLGHELFMEWDDYTKMNAVNNAVNFHKIATLEKIIQEKPAEIEISLPSDNYRITGIDVALAKSCSEANALGMKLDVILPGGN